MNGTMIQFFHWYTEGGKLWKEVREKAQYLADLEITAVWLPPAYKANGGNQSVGYDAYDLFDLGEFDQKGSIDTKYGYKEDYIAAVKSLQQVGIQVIVDVVLNHKAGGDEKETFQVVQVDQNDRTKVVSQPFDIESYTKFTFPGRQGKYSEFIWTFTCFSGVDYAEGRENGVYRIINEFSDTWGEVADNEKGNYDYLMFNDINFNNPNVCQELYYWGKWYHDQIKFQGVRLDAVKHIAPQFYKDWLYKLRETTGENIFAVGEFWAPGRLDLLEKYYNATEGCMSLFDSALHANFQNASKMGSDYDLRKIFDQTFVSAHPDKAVTVTANHDTMPLQALEAPLQDWFKPIAHALILFREQGYPCLFYPNLFGAKYKDTGKDGGEYEIELFKVAYIEEMIKARAHHAYGTQRDYFEDANCIGWTREGDDQHTGMAVLISNKDAYTKPMEIGARYAGKQFYDLLQHSQDPITIDENGWGEFQCPPGGVSVWLCKENQ